MTRVKSLALVLLKIFQPLRKIAIFQSLPDSIKLISTLYKLDEVTIWPCLCPPSLSITFKCINNNYTSLVTYRRCLRVHIRCLWCVGGYLGKGPLPKLRVIIHNHCHFYNHKLPRNNCAIVVNRLPKVLSRELILALTNCFFV